MFLVIRWGKKEDVRENAKNSTSLFVDESGDLKYRENDRYFVLVGVIAEAKDVPKIERRLYEFMNEKGFVPFVELHASDIIHGSKNSPYEFLTFEFRRRLLEELSDIIRELPITIVGIVVKKEKVGEDELETENYAEGVLRSAYRLLVERVCRFLEDAGGRGVLVIDMPEQKEAIRWKFWIREEVENGPFTNPDVLVSVPIFADSVTSRLIQIADVVAYTLRRYWFIKDKAVSELTRTDSLIKELFQKVASKIRKGPDGKIEGYGVKYWEFLGKLPQKQSHRA